MFLSLYILIVQHNDIISIQSIKRVPEKLAITAFKSHIHVLIE